MNTLVYTNGNNVFEVNKWNRFLFYIPRAIRQFGLILFNIQPNYLIFDPMNSLVSKLFYIKLYFILFSSICFITNLYVVKSFRFS